VRGYLFLYQAHLGRSDLEVVIENFSAYQEKTGAAVEKADKGDGSNLSKVRETSTDGKCEP